MNEQIKIQPKSSIVNINIVKELKSKNIEFHIYKPKKDRSFKVVLKHIHAIANLDNTKTEIEDLDQLLIYGTPKTNKIKRLFICSVSS